MKNIIEDIDEKLKDFLQNDVEFHLNGKIIKAGKLYLYEHGHFNYLFHIQTNAKKTTIKIPFPFNFTEGDCSVYFDYTIKEFAFGMPEIEKIVSKIKPPSPSKFYNNVLLIRKV